MFQGHRIFLEHRYLKFFGTKFLGYHFRDTAWIVGPLGEAKKVFS